MAKAPTFEETYGRPETVEVYSKTTGIKHFVPEEWLSDPVLGKDFRKTPLSEAAKPVDQPADSSATKK